MSYSAEQKRAAELNQDKAQGVAITSAPAVAGIALIPPFGPAIGVGVAAVGAAFGLYALSLNRIIRDPPDENFRASVEVAETARFTLGEIGESPVAEWAIDLAATIEGAAAFAVASVTSLERAEGAIEEREFEFAETRREEGLVFARYFADRLELAAERSTTPPDELPTVRLIVSPAPESMVLGEVLAPETVARLFRAGINREYVFEPLGRWLSPEDPSRVRPEEPGGFEESLVEFAAAAAEYADQIRRELAEGQLWNDEGMAAGGPVAPA